MKPGDYRIQVHIMEAKDIKAKGKAGGGGFLSAFEGETADPMVEVSTCHNFTQIKIFYIAFLVQLLDFASGRSYGTV